MAALDTLVLEGFQRVQDQAVLRTDPRQVARRTIKGRLSLVCQVNDEHFAQKRHDALGGSVQQHVHVAFDSARFNFTKISKDEKLLDLEAALQEGVVLANVSPLSVGHVLLVPQPERLEPQLLTREAVSFALGALMQARRPDCRLVFNSMAGFASVNHLHFHMMWLEHVGLERFPVESAERRIISLGQAEGEVTMEVIEQDHWYVRCFVLSICSKEDPEVLARSIFGLISELQARNVPHNLLIAPASAQEAVLRCFIFARKGDSQLRGDAGFNAAVCELSGLIVCHHRAVFEALGEDRLCAIFADDVSLPQTEFQDLLQSAPWKVGPPLFEDWEDAASENAASEDSWGLPSTLPEELKPK